MNTPSLQNGNWRWRLNAGHLSTEVAKTGPSRGSKRSPPETLCIPDYGKFFRIAACPTAKTNAETVVSGLCNVEERQG